MNLPTFNKGEVVMPKGSDYPSGALEVDGYDQQGNLLAHPLGGGPQYKIDPAGQISFRIVMPQEKKAAPFRKAKFSLEGVEGEFEGWTDGTLWNGWATPHFELTEAKKVIKALHPAKASFDEAKDAFITESPDGEQEVWEANQIKLPDGTQLKVYPVGAWAWCWDEIE